MNFEAAAQSVGLLRGAFRDGVLHSISTRKDVLRAIIKMLDENEDAFVEASIKDLHRPKDETTLIELLPIKLEVNHMLKNVDNWVKEQYLPKSFLSMMDTTSIQLEPYGVVLILGAWNFPFALCFVPMIGAIAAGNTVVLKPSEYAPASAALIANLVPKYIEKHICQVVTGDVQFTQELLEKERFDYVFFTGGYDAGRAVYVAAAKHVTPVTLELGGKCPSYVDSQVSIEMAAKRIAFSKSFNAGQVCVATDYVLCHKDIFEEFKRALLDVYKQFYGEDPQRTAQFSRIVNNRHFKRLTGMLSNTKGKIILGGDSDEEDLFIAPTIVTFVTKDDVLMREEIFGPILPIIVVDSATEAIEFINSRNKPLAIYVFTTDNNVFANFKHGTSSGAISQNDCVTHLLLSQLPFGGIGTSGFGNYHGRFSLETFSHKRAVLLKAQTEVVNNKFLYPPYTEDKLSWAKWFLSSSERSQCSIL